MFIIEIITEQERNNLLKANELLRKKLFSIELEIFKNKMNEEKVSELQIKENNLKKQIKLNLLKIKTYELYQNKERGNENDKYKGK